MGILLAPDMGLVGESRAQLGIGGLKEDCTWNRESMGITVWELNRSHEDLKADGKSLLRVTLL